MRKWSLKRDKDGYEIVNKGGKKLSYDPLKGIRILEDDGFAFLDLNGNGRLDGFEDWRLGAREQYRLLRLNLI